MMLERGSAYCIYVQMFIGLHHIEHNIGQVHILYSLGSYMECKHNKTVYIRAMKLSHLKTCLAHMHTLDIYSGECLSLPNFLKLCT